MTTSPIEKKCNVEATNIYSVQGKGARAMPECRMSYSGGQKFENAFQEGQLCP